jgi:uncharacterized protein YbjT (DUF2867 family)
VARGVQRLVLLSWRGEDEAERAEEVVQASGVDWTHVRASRFSQNFSENYLLDAVLDGRNAQVKAGVQRALGREPRDFSDYARETAATGVWGVPAMVGAR